MLVAGFGLTLLYGLLVLDDPEHSYLSLNQADNSLRPCFGGCSLAEPWSTAEGDALTQEQQEVGWRSRPVRRLHGSGSQAGRTCSGGRRSVPPGR
jgi:hypothetical protein